MRILIVEDDPTSNLVLAGFLKSLGEITSVTDGKAGLDAFRKAFEEGCLYDLVTLDIMMPHMDGQEVLRQIRALEQEFDIPPEGAVKVIMTTALDDRQNLAQALPRCDAYLTKPIDKAKLMYYIKSFGLIDGGDAGREKQQERKRHEQGNQPPGEEELPWVG